jgi:4-hydroxyacetophenone monooxygenase
MIDQTAKGAYVRDVVMPTPTHVSDGRQGTDHERRTNARAPSAGGARSTPTGVTTHEELLAASDATIEDAIEHADPMALRGLLFQLTGDAQIAATNVKAVPIGFGDAIVPATADDLSRLRRAAVDLLKRYRDAGAGPIDIGPKERLPTSVRLAIGEEVPDEDLGLHLEELALDPWARSLRWEQRPDSGRLRRFSVTVIGAGLGGLNAAVHLKRAGIPFRVIEKNGGVGGTWFENRYPGARVDTPSRSYTHLFGAGFGYSSQFCEWTENQGYFDWVADTFDLRGDITFNTEVRSMTWHDETAEWALVVDGPDGERELRSNAVISAVGYLNRPKLPDIEGMLSFKGPAWHSSRWPEGMDLGHARVAVIGTGCTGIQMIPELALEARHMTVFQRTPQWLFAAPGYRSPFEPQVGWLDRNFPYYTNFMRMRAAYGNRRMAVLSEIDPKFEDPDACSAINGRARDSVIGFIEQKISDAALAQRMIPQHPVMSARPVIVDADYCYLDAIQRNNVTLVTDGIRRITETGIEDTDGRHHEVDAIVYATGFHATEYLYPMRITGREGRRLDEFWADGGARAYVGCMIAGFPNLWTIYGPNTNGGLSTAGFHELITVYALQCIERLIVEDARSMEVDEGAYWRFNHTVDQRNLQKVWSDPRAHNYYWTQHGRSATMCPFYPGEVWRLLRHPDFADLRLG